MNSVVQCVIYEAESTIKPDLSLHKDIKIGIVDGSLSAAVFQEQLGI